MTPSFCGWWVDATVDNNLVGSAFVGELCWRQRRVSYLHDVKKNPNPSSSIISPVKKVHTNIEQPPSPKRR